MKIKSFCISLILLFTTSILPVLSFDHYSDLADATVLIRVTRDGNKHSIGSGVLINNKGVILTCKHVINNASNIQVSFRDTARDTYQAKIIKVSKVNDIALIELQTSPSQTHPFVHLAGDINLGEDLYAIGHPEAHFWSITRGIASNWFFDKAECLVLQTDTTITFGNSGGGVYNNKGELVGISASIFNPFPKRLKREIGNTGIAYIIPVPEIIKFYLE